MKNFLKILLDNISYKSDEVRENCSTLIHLLIPRSERLHIYVPYVLETLIERTNCSDLDNNKSLPEEMKPTPSMKPHLIFSIPEKVEEIRLIYTDILQDILECSEEEIVIEFLQDLVDLLRVFMMDPCKEV